MKILPHELKTKIEVTGPLAERKKPKKAKKPKKPNINWREIQPHCKHMLPEEIAETWGLKVNTVKSARRRGAIECKKHPTHGAKWGRGEARKMVAQLITTGMTQHQIAKTIGISRNAVEYHVKQLGLVFGRRTTEADRQEIKKLRDQGTSFEEIEKQTGWSTWTIRKVVKNG